MFNINIKNRLLLTGAGFSKNFGGYLASEMWAQIFNTNWVGESDTLRQILIGNQNFESVYSKVLDDPASTPDDRDRIKQAVRNAYRSLDNAIKTRGLPGHPYSPNVMRLIDLFGGSASSRALIFTLNQDLWLERQAGVNCLGIDNFTRLLVDRYDEELLPEQFVSIRMDGIVERAKNDAETRSGYIYLKLHGSYGWKTHENPDQMIIGTTKERMIRDHALFSWYFEVLKWAIARGDQMLLIIGYGFKDEHVNQLILEGVQRHGLKLYVATTTPLDRLTNEMTYGHYSALGLLMGIRGYYPWSLSEIFPGDQRVTDHARRIRSDLE
jgi:hypothetical protein